MSINKVEAENLRVQRMVEIIAEQERLESKPMSKSDEARHQRLGQEFAALKIPGVGVQEFAAARASQLQKELGIEEPTISSGALEQWRALASRQVTEIRVDSQATSQWGNTVALTYDGTSGTQGGVFVPSTAPLTDRIYSALAQYSGIVDVGRIWTSDKGSQGVVPYVKDYTVGGSPVVATFAKSTILDESVQSATTQFATSKLAFGKVKKFRSGRVAIALELAQDAPDLFAGTAALLESLFTQRFALGYGEYCVNYIMSNLGSAQNVTTAANNVIGLFDVEALYAAQPEVYRRDSVILCSDNVRTQITAAFEAAARTAVGPVLEVLRCPIIVCPDMPDMAAGQTKVAVMVSKSRLIHRRVTGGNIIRVYKEAVGIIEQGLQAVEHFGRADFGVVGIDDPYFPCASVLNMKS